jgi:hypothetical protein
MDLCELNEKYIVDNRMWVSGSDVYTEDWPDIGLTVRLYRETINPKTLPELQKVRSGLNVSTMMILSGYNLLWGNGISYEARLNGAVDAIIYGANGLMFYFDNADYILSPHYGQSGEWATDQNWDNYKNSNAYKEIKQVASILNKAYPGLTGTKNGSITANLPVLAKNGTDGKLYLFAANETYNDIQTGFNGLPNGNYYEITQNQTFSATQLSSFTFPSRSVRIFVQGSPSPTATPTPTPFQAPTNLSVSCNAQGTSATFCWDDKNAPKYNLRVNASSPPADTNYLPGTGPGKDPYDSWICQAFVPSGGRVCLTQAVTAGMTYSDWNVGSTANCESDRVFSSNAPSFVCMAPTSTPLSGDLNNDQKVNIFDLRYFLANFLKIFTIFDYNKLVENFGK